MNTDNLFPNDPYYPILRDSWRRIGGLPIIEEKIRQRCPAIFKRLDMLDKTVDLDWERGLRGEVTPEAFSITMAHWEHEYRRLSGLFSPGGNR